MGGYYAPNHSRMLVFGLGSNVQLPPAEPYTPPPLDPPPSTASTEEIKAGGETPHRAPPRLFSLSLECGKGALGFPRYELSTEFVH